jgi:hypothetical protein
VIAAAAITVLALAPGTRALTAVVALGLVLVTVSIWLKDRRDAARHQASMRRLSVLKRDADAAAAAQQKELSRVLYFTGAGPQTKATVGNIRKDLHRLSGTVSRIEAATSTTGAGFSAEGLPSAAEPPHRRAPARNGASPALKHPASETAAGRIAASVAPDPQRTGRLSALLEDTAEHAPKPALVQTIALPETLAKLQEHYTVRPLRPDLMHLHDETSFLVIEARALRNGIWHGILHASHGRRYRELRDVLVAARQRSVLVIHLDDDEAPWHFDNELRSRAHLTLAPGARAADTPWAPDRPLDIVSILSE